MNWQNLVALILLGGSIIFSIKMFVRQLSQVEKDPKCEGCPIPELKTKLR